jgi:hypothetical protein
MNPEEELRKKKFTDLIKPTRTKMSGASFSSSIATTSRKKGKSAE